MAFTFKAEDGTGLSNANSYVTVAFCDDFHDGRGHTKWSGTGDQKKEYIVRATDHVEKRFGHRFVGCKASRSQGLSWPREDAVDRDGFTIPTPDWQDATVKSLANDTITVEGHGLEDGDRVKVRDAGNGLPGGLAADTPYFAIDVDSDTLKLEASEGGGSVDITSDLGGSKFELIHDAGVPLVVQQAVAEYALRALEYHELDPDPPLPVPQQDQTSGATHDTEAAIGEVEEKEETVGPITKRTRYKQRSQIRPQSGPLTSYPAADLLLKPVLRRGGKVVRA